MKVRFNLLTILFSWHTFIVLIASVAFVALMVISINLRDYFEEQSFTHSESAFEQEASYNDELFMARTQLYYNSIESLKGLLVASDFVSDKEFDQIISTLAISQSYPALEQIYVLELTNDATDSADIITSSDTQYDVRLLRNLQTEDYFDGQTVLPSEEIIHLATSESTLKVEEVDDILQETDHHIFMLFPFKEDVLVAVINLNSIFEETLLVRTKESNINFIVEKTDPGNNKEIFNTNPDIPRNRQEHTNTLTLGGHTWKVTQWATVNFGLNSVFRILPQISLLLGVLISVLGSLFIYFFFISRHRSLQIAKSELAQSEKKLRTLFENMAQGVVYQDVEGKITSANNAAEEILGLTVDQMQGKKSIDPDWKAIHPDGSEFPGEEHPAMVALRTGKRVNDVIMGVFHPTKQDYKWLKINSVPQFRKGETKPYQVFTTFDDITKIKEIEETKDDFLSIAAHQLRTPLGGIRWNTEMMLEGDMGKLPPELKEAIKKNYDTLLRLNKIVDDLLNVSRIDQNRVQDDPKPTELNKVIESVITDSKTQLDEKEIKLLFNKTDLPKVTLDPQRLQIIIQNLVSNAIKYTPKGGNIEISELKTESAFSVSVKDTGMGIEPHEINNIFRKFYRASSAIKMEARGSGLGLYLVKSYTEAWGGKVDVKSEVGKGSTFTITVPLNPKKSTLNENLKDNPHTT